MREEQKKLADLRELNKKKDNNFITEESLKALTAKEQDVVNGKPVLFRPNPGPQTEFLEASEDTVLFAGARGGGKSYALIIDPLRYADNKNFRALILRKTMPELRQLIGWAKDIYLQAFPGTRWKEQEKSFVFPSGAKSKV